MMARKVRCKECGKYGLIWTQTHKGWRLAWPKSGKLHMCKAGKAWAEDKAPNTQAEMIERGWLQPLEPSAIFTGQADPVGTTKSHLSPTYAYKPRLRCHRFKRNGRVVYNCTQLADGVRIKGLGPTPEVAYDNLLRASTQYEVEALPAQVAEEHKRRHRWLAGPPIALAIAALFYFFAWVFSR